MSAALFDPGLENKQTPVIQRNYFSQANSVAGSYVLGVMFFKFWGMLQWNDFSEDNDAGDGKHLGRFPINFLIDVI